jgi:hypothetical protein
MPAAGKCRKGVFRMKKLLLVMLVPLVVLGIIACGGGSVTGNDVDAWVQGKWLITTNSIGGGGYSLEATTAIDALPGASFSGPGGSATPQATLVWSYPGNGKDLLPQPKYLSGTPIKEGEIELAISGTQVTVTNNWTMSVYPYRAEFAYMTKGRFLPVQDFRDAGALDVMALYAFNQFKLKTYKNLDLTLLGPSGGTGVGPVDVTSGGKVTSYRGNENASNISAKEAYLLMGAGGVLPAESDVTVGTTTLKDVLSGVTVGSGKWAIVDADTYGDEEEIAAYIAANKLDDDQSWMGDMVVTAYSAMGYNLLGTDESVIAELGKEDVIIGKISLFSYADDAELAIISVVMSRNGSNAYDQLAIFDIEIVGDAVDAWWKLDENAIPKAGIYKSK